MVEKYAFWYILVGIAIYLACVYAHVPQDILGIPDDPRG